MSDVYLSSYRPVSKLIVKEHHLPTPKFDVIDFHTHFGDMMIGEGYASLYDTSETVEVLRSHGVKRVVNLDGAYGEGYERMMEKLKGFEDFIINFATLDLSRFERPDFEKYVYDQLSRHRANGVRGLKLWKVLGLSIKGADSKYLRADDERLRPIWAAAAELDMPVLIHIADPVAFFDPIDSSNERFEELNAHPDWSFCSKKLYTFEQLMQQQENLLESNPKTTFVVAHVGSYCENLAKVGEWLTRYDNMYVDFADRIAELGRQPYTARDFLIEHSDRVLFGTDMHPLDAHRYSTYYRFLETRDEYFDYCESAEIPPQGRWRIYGVDLPDDVLQRIYSLNAKRLLNLS